MPLPLVNKQCWALGNTWAVRGYSQTEGTSQALSCPPGTPRLCFVPASSLRHYKDDPDFLLMSEGCPWSLDQTRSSMTTLEVLRAQCWKELKLQECFGQVNGPIWNRHCDYKCLIPFLSPGSFSPFPHMFPKGQNINRNKKDHSSRT